MAEYTIHIRANLSARNFESAQTKLDELKEKLGRRVDFTEVHLSGLPEKDGKAND